MLKKKFLLVDDSEIDLFINKRSLEIESLAESIVCKKSAMSALQYLTAATEDCIPDYILLDIKMPGMDGFGFLERLCHMNFLSSGKAKVIMVTSSDSTADIERAMKFKRCGLVDYLEKPLSAEKIQYLKSIVSI